MAHTMLCDLLIREIHDDSRRFRYCCANNCAKEESHSGVHNCSRCTSAGSDGYLFGFPVVSPSVGFVVGLAGDVVEIGTGPGAAAAFLALEEPETEPRATTGSTRVGGT